MKPAQNGIIYHGGTLPVPSRLQKGSLRLQGDRLLIRCPQEDPLYNLDLSIPLDRIIRAVARERKYYSSVAYLLIIDYLDDQDREIELELEIRSFIRRGRAQALSRYWAELLSKGQPVRSE
jgi:hypothetical protein